MAVSTEREQGDGSLRKSREEESAWVELVRAQVASLRFGTVLITVHESRVVQVEKSEKVRLAGPQV